MFKYVFNIRMLSLIRHFVIVYPYLGTLFYLAIYWKLYDVDYLLSIVIRIPAIPHIVHCV